MIRTILFQLVFWLYPVVAFPLLVLVAIPLHLLGKLPLTRRIAHPVSKFWCRLMLMCVGIRTTVTGELQLPEGATSALFISNHQNDFDIPVLMCAVRYPIGFLAKRELAYHPILYPWMRYIGCHFMDRRSPRKAMKTILEVVESLKDGVSVVIFPEGTRSGSTEMARFKKGSLNVAVKAGVPIVPLTLNGTYKAKASGSWRLRPAKVTVHIGEPIDTANLTKEQKAALADDAHAVIHARLQTMLAALPPPS